ncbi:MAG: DUF4340 domain-containing protein [Oscillospiraceae bacterium]|nr:DUF4340 domain-containing protein [Oscillospiraceae bacterium]
MKKTVIAIFALFAILCGLIVLIFLLQGGREEEPLPEALGDLPTVFELAAPVGSIVIEQAGKEPFELEKLSRDGEVSGTLSGRESLPVDYAKCAAVLQAAVKLPYIKAVVAEAQDYSPYGLEPPIARVSISSESNESVTLIIGDIAPDGTGRYLRREDSSEILLVPVYALDNYLLSEYDYLSHTLTPPAGTPLYFERMTLSGGGRDEEVVIIASDQEGYFEVAAPVSHPLDPTGGFAAVSGVFSMGSGNIARIDITDEDLIDFGLDNPWASVEVESGISGNFTVVATEPDRDGHVFLYREGVPVLYTAEAQELDWLAVSWRELISDTACAPPVEALSALRVSCGELLLSASLYGGEKDLTVALNGGALGDEARDNFIRFYETLTAASFLEEAEDFQQNREPWLEARYILSKGEERTVRVYKGLEGFRDYIKVDEGRVFLLSKSYTSKLETALENILEGAIVPSYIAI